MTSHIFRTQNFGQQIAVTTASKANRLHVFEEQLGKSRFPKGGKIP